jgi:DNA-binding transcriptional MerR regulator
MTFYSQRDLAKLLGCAGSTLNYYYKRGVLPRPARSNGKNLCRKFYNEQDWESLKQLIAMLTK